jgi:PEP-CTERM/exosortase A-associated glycosyltransferase
MSKVSARLRSPPKGSPLRILHLFDHSIPLHSGYTFRSRAILNAQRAMGWETAHVTSAKQGETKAETEIVDGLEFHRTPVSAGVKIPVAGQLFVSSTLAQRAQRVVKSFKPDLIHAHSPSLVAHAALTLKRQFNLPVLYEVRSFWEDAAVDFGKAKEGDVRYRLTRAHETYALKRADAVACICEGLRKDIAARGIPNDNLFVVGNSIHIEQFPPIAGRDAELAKKIGVGADPCIGFIGSFYPYEGLDLLVGAMPALLKNTPALKLLMVGGGMEDGALKAQAKSLDVEHSIIFTGRIDHHLVAAYSSLVDLFVFPRKKMRLTDLVTPLKPLEAMAQTRLLAASDVGGHQELIRDGETGFLFQSNSVSALAACVERALQLSPEARNLIAKNGLDYVRNERDWSVTVKRYETAYAAAINNSKR